MDSLDWLFADSAKDDCQIVELSIDVVDVSSSSENENINFKLKKESDNYCNSPPLFDDDTQIEDNLNDGENINNGNQSTPEIEMSDCHLEEENYETEFLLEVEETIDSVGQDHVQMDITNESIVEPIDINYSITDNSLIKAGNNRKRKKFIINKSERTKHRKAKQRNQHQLKPPCSLSCKKLCNIKFTNKCRKQINNMFWLMNWSEQGNFIQNMSSKSTVSRKTVNSNKRQYTMTYSLHDDQEEIQNVCQTFFLATLGYNKNNNSILRRIQCKKNYTTVETRGKYCREVGYKEIIRKHIESFNPTSSHYRREHCPNKRYLPSDITIQIMYDSFLIINPTMKCSYDTYRKIVKELNISFTILGNEECERCATFNLIKIDHQNCDAQCNTCTDYKLHKTRYVNSRQAYEQCKSSPWDLNEISLSVDLQKVIMLPRMDMYKQILFTRRIVAFNESFVPIGTCNKNKKPMAVIWHQGTTGRKKEDIISAFHKCIVQYRDVKKIKFWLDNCSSQNKNWALFSYLVTIVNSYNVNAEEIQLWYFEPGHTFMSADSFHHQVELSLKRQKKTYDFNDFHVAVSNANKGNCIVEVLTEQDLYFWTDNSSQTRIKKSTGRPYLKDMVQVKFKRNSTHLFYSSEYDDDGFIELPFLKTSVEKKGLILPENINRPTGISAKHHQQIIKDILPLLPKNRHAFWKSLPISDNLTEDDS